MKHVMKISNAVLTNERRRFSLREDFLVQEEIPALLIFFYKNCVYMSCKVINSFFFLFVFALYHILVSNVFDGD